MTLQSTMRDRAASPYGRPARTSRLAAWALLVGLAAGLGGLGPIGIASAQAPACPPGQDCPCVWTAWLDRDDPSGVGDFETLPEFIKDGKACKRPTAIQCRYKPAGAMWGHQTLPLGPAPTPAGYNCVAAKGGWCTNTQTKPPGSAGKPSCRDSEVRFCCAKE